MNVIKRILKIIMKIVLDFGIFVVAVVFLMSVYYFIHGSFEWVPTQEQMEKAKITAAFLGTLCLTVGAFLLMCRIKLDRKGD